MNDPSLQMIAPQDVPRVWELMAEQNEKDGTDFLVPRIFDDKDRQLPGVPLALKLVHKGAIIKAHIFERRLELLDIGLSRRGTLLSLEHMPAALWLLEQQGYTGFHGCAPLSRIEAWEATLGKRLNMQRDDDRLAHFYRAFREDCRG